jgi:hypothetical protein
MSRSPRRWRPRAGNRAAARHRRGSGPSLPPRRGRALVLGRQALVLVPRST